MTVTGSILFKPRKTEKTLQQRLLPLVFVIHGKTLLSILTFAPSPKTTRTPIRTTRALRSLVNSALGFGAIALTTFHPTRTFTLQPKSGWVLCVLSCVTCVSWFKIFGSDGHHCHPIFNQNHEVCISSYLWVSLCAKKLVVNPAPCHFPIAQNGHFRDL